MYRKDLLKDWFGPHLIDCEWYFDWPKDCTPSSRVSLCEIFELGFTKKVIETFVFQGLKKSRDVAKKKGKEKYAALESMVDIERP
jgi:hypothetical protein